MEKAINGPSSWRRYLKLSVKLALYGDLKKDRAAAATASKVSMKTGGRQRAKLREKMVQAAGNDGDEAKNNKGTPGVGVTDGLCFWIGRKEVVHGLGKVFESRQKS